ncbi:unnamed protein product [Symbiodinium sp. CCMP2592]|nr:unnamed protein product [Symbiodinium sp. CCMP2592]
MATASPAEQPVPEEDVDDDEPAEPFDPWAAGLLDPGKALAGYNEIEATDGVPFDDMKYLAKSESWMKAKDGGEQLLAAMDTRDLYGDDEREDMLNSLFKITYSVRRQKNEGHKEFFSRWELAIRKLSEHNITLPAENLGFLLTMALQLNQEEVKLLMNFTQGKLSQKDVKEWVRVHETNLDLKSSGHAAATIKNKPVAAYHTETQEDYHDPPDGDEAGQEDNLEVLLSAMQDLDEADQGDFNGEDSGVFDEEDAREILSTMVKEHARKRTFTAVNEAKKNKSLARGYGAGARHSFGKGGFRPAPKGGFEGSYKVSIEALKRRTRCSNCQQIGHWHREFRECPRPPRSGGKGAKGDKEHSAHLMETGAHEAHFLGFEDFLRIKKAINDEAGDMMKFGSSSGSGQKPQPASTASTLPAYKERLPGHDVLFLDRASQVPWDDDDTCATVDTGCQRSAVGSDTLQKMLECQPPGLRTIVKNEIHHFKSINGISRTNRVACVPTSLGPKGCLLRPAVFEDEATRKAPFLLSLPFLLHCRSVLHLDPEQGLQLELKKFNHVVPLHIGPSGALRVPLHRFTREMYAELSQAVDQLQGAHDVHQLTEPCEDRLRNHPSAFLPPRDPPPSAPCDHAGGKALPDSEARARNQRERASLEQDGAPNDHGVCERRVRGPRSLLIQQVTNELPQLTGDELRQLRLAVDHHLGRRSVEQMSPEQRWQAYRDQRK